MADVREKHGPGILTRGHVIVITGVLALFFLVLAGRSFATPVQIEEKTTTGILKQEVTFEHSAVPLVSALYPSPSELRNQETYFTQITDQFSVSVKADVVTEPEAVLKGTSQVILSLQAGDLWSRDYILDNSREFEGRGRFTVIDGTFRIPLTEILAFTKQVEEETRVTPNDGYTLSVQPVINAHVNGSGEPLSNEFTPSYAIALTQREIKPAGEAVQEQTAELTVTGMISGTVGILGFQIPVVTARYALSVLTVLCACLTLWMLQQRQRSRPLLSEAEMINRRYRSRIVTASKGVIDPDMSTIQLESFKALLKIADEMDKSIICLNESQDDKEIYRYCIPEGKTLYCYVASGPRPDDSPRRTLRERVMARRSLADQVIPEDGMTK